MGESIKNVALKFLQRRTTHADKRLLGIADGCIGELACLAYLWKNFGKSIYRKLFLDMFYLAIDSPINDHSLGYGLASFAWLTNLIRQEELLAEDIEDIDLREINRRIEREFYLMVDARNFDYFRGATGLIMYFSQQEDKALFSRAARYFGKEVERCLHERYKFSSIRNNGSTMEMVTNIGVPHGLTGILLTLLLVKEKDPECCKDSIVVSFANLLLSHRFERPDKSYFPSFVYEDGRKDESGIAWCYGDLMIAYSFLKIERVMNMGKFSSIGNMIIESIVKRNIPMNDLCLCHGLPSLYHIFRGIYKYSPNAEYLVIAEKAYNKLEELFKKKVESVMPDSNDSFFMNRSLFYGYSSALLTILHRDIPNARWQSCLLI